MTFVYLLGAGYCERCKQICGRRSRRTRQAVKKEKPVTLKYVRYPAGTVVTPGWNGVDKPAVIPRIPAYWTYAGAMAKRAANNMGVVSAMPAAVPLSVSTNTKLSRKRKHVD
ncbi:MAG: hypothetical protein [psittacine adenovirus 7]|uniref:Uncharacterized protein n=1 Tax=psittacine adenovirus 7 TaxID=2848040 RepID=A0A6B9LXY7_9ADEN|nr:MAG: hypothetical protein QKN13_gp02 [psittacine adenovirus 7]QHB43569.1 MAG: hypothetical protein [psittacine adenovirus 7]